MQCPSHHSRTYSTHTHTHTTLLRPVSEALETTLVKYTPTDPDPDWLLPSSMQLQPLRQLGLTLFPGRQETGA